MKIHLLIADLAELSIWDDIGWLKQKPDLLMEALKKGIPG